MLIPDITVEMIVFMAFHTVVIMVLIVLMIVEITVLIAPHTVICPDFISSIDSASASYKLPAGEISVAWERRNGEIFLTVSAAPSVKIELSEKLSGANVTINRI